VGYHRADTPSGARSGNPESRKAAVPGAKWHARFHQELPPEVKVWLTLCDPTGVTTLVWSYVESYDAPAQSRRKFSRDLKRNLETAISALEKARDLCLQRFGPADPRMDQAVALVRQELTLLQPLLNERRLGVGNPVWILAYLEAYIERATGRTPSPRILSRLVQAGRAASRRPLTSWDFAEVIGKNLRNFKRRKDNATFLRGLTVFISRMPLHPASTRSANSTETKPVP